MTDHHVAIEVFVSTNNNLVLAALPADKAVVLMLAVPVVAVGNAPAYDMNGIGQGTATIVCPPTLRRYDVSMIEAAVELWAENMRQMIAARVQIPSVVSPNQ